MVGLPGYNFQWMHNPVIGADFQVGENWIGLHFHLFINDYMSLKGDDDVNGIKMDNFTNFPENSDLDDPINKGAMTDAYPLYSQIRLIYSWGK